MGCPSKNVVDPSKNLGNDLTVKTHVSLVPTVSIWASIWLGKGSTEYEKELAKRIGNELDNHNSIIIDEG